MNHSPIAQEIRKEVERAVERYLIEQNVVDHRFMAALHGQRIADTVDDVVTSVMNRNEAVFYQP